MRQVLFWIPREVLIGGGIAIGVAILAFAIFLALKRRPSIGPFVGAAVVFGVLFWAWTRNLLPDNLPIFGFGAMLFLAFVACTWLAAVLSKREGIDFERTQDLSIWIFICGIIGARLFFILFVMSDAEPRWHWFAIWDGGLVFYGGFVGGVIGFFAAYIVFLHKYHISRWKMVDIIAPCGALGLCLGRIGCLLNGCCYGNIACDHCPSIHFPLSAPPRYDFVKRGLQTAAGFTMAGTSTTEVAEVEPDSPAYKVGGLRKGDFITRINEQKIDSYSAMVAAFGQDWPRGINYVKLEVERGTVEAARVKAGGSGYTSAPTVVFTGGTGFGATGTATISAGSVSAITITSGGGGYTSSLPPTILLTGGGGTGAMAEADVKVDVLKLPPFRHGTIGLHPTQIYESISMGLLLFVLLAYYPLKKYDGSVFVLFMAAYSVHRFLNEMLRDDTAKVANTGMTLSQNLSILLIAAAVVMFFLMMRHGRLAQAQPAVHAGPVMLPTIQPAAATPPETAIAPGPGQKPPSPGTPENP